MASPTTNNNPTSTNNPPTNRFPVAPHLTTNNTAGAGRNLGQSEKNTAQKSRAKVLLAAIAKKMCIPSFEALDPKEDLTTREEMIEYYRNIATCLACGVPHNVDENFESTSNSVLCWTTVNQMMSMINTLMKEKFPTNPAFPARKGDNDEWYNDLTKKSMKKEFERNFQKWQKDPDYKVGHYEVVPIYRDPQPQCENRDLISISEWRTDGIESAEEQERRLGIRALSVWSTRFISRKLFHAIDPFMKETSRNLALFNYTWLSAGRPGEVRDLRVDMWQHHPGLGVVDSKWVESKTINTHSMAQVMCKSDPTRCFYYTLFVLMTMGNLERTQKEQRTNQASWLFPDLQRFKASETPNILGKILSRCLPKNAPQELKNGTTGKSIRSGAVTQMCMTPGMSLHDVCARSGHSYGNNVDYYNALDNNLSVSIKGANALNGQSRTPRPPFVEQLPVHYKDGIEAMIKVYHSNCDIPAFLPGGHLYELTRISFAVGLMWHNQVERDFSYKHPVVQWLRNCANHVDLAHLCPDPQDDGWSEDNCTSILERLSDQMLTKFLLENPDQNPSLSPSERQMEESMLGILNKIELLRAEDAKNEGVYRDSTDRTMKKIHEELISLRVSKNKETAELLRRCEELEHKLAIGKMSPMEGKVTQKKMSPPQAQAIPVPGFAMAKGTYSSPVDLNTPQTQPSQPSRPIDVLPAPNQLFQNVNNPNGCSISAYSNNEINITYTSAAKRPAVKNPYTTNKNKKSKTTAATGTEVNPFFLPKAARAPKSNSHMEEINEKYSEDARGITDVYLVSSAEEAARKTATKSRKADKIVWTSQDNKRLKGNGNLEGNIPCSDMLQCLLQHGYFQLKQRVGVHESCLKAKWAFHNIMELIDLLISEDEDGASTGFLFEKAPAATSDEFRQFRERIQNLVEIMMDRIRDFEGKGEEQETTVPDGKGGRKPLKAAGRKPSKNVGAMAKRLQHVKLKLKADYPSSNGELKNWKKEEPELEPGQLLIVVEGGKMKLQKQQKKQGQAAVVEEEVEEEATETGTEEKETETREGSMELE